MLSLAPSCRHPFRGGEARDVPATASTQTIPYDSIPTYHNIVGKKGTKKAKIIPARTSGLRWFFLQLGFVYRTKRYLRGNWVKVSPRLSGIKVKQTPYGGGNQSRALSARILYSIERSFMALRWLIQFTLFIPHCYVVMPLAGAPGCCPWPGDDSRPPGCPELPPVAPVATASKPPFPVLPLYFFCIFQLI